MTSIAAAATITNKTENQDAHGVGDVPYPALLVADGMGSFQYAKQASDEVIESLSVCIKQHSGPVSNDDIRSWFKKAHEALHTRRINLEGTVQHAADRFGTTAVIAIETDEELVLAYVGNGAAWHIRPNIKLFTTQPPWTAMNVLNPHTVPQDGKEVLERYLSDEEDPYRREPSIIRIQKDRRAGDIIMLCTDGIHSADQQRMGRNEKGLWVRYDERMSIFFKKLPPFIEAGSDGAQERLQELLNSYLEEVRDGLDDDATIGVLLTRETFHPEQ